MEVQKIYIDGPLVIQPKVFYDDRGYFFEPYNKEKLKNIGLGDDFVQDNQSLSQKGAVRGLHFQAPPFAQGKLVRVVNGSVLDVIVDIRKNSPTYGRSFALELSESNMTMLWVPPGFAHGFSTLQDQTIFQYKCTNYYNKASEGGILWSDSDLSIDWQINDPIVSEKDKMLPRFKDFQTPFTY